MSDRAWSLIIRDASGAFVVTLYRVPRSLVEAALCDYFLDAPPVSGIGTHTPDHWSRAFVWQETW